jgi:glutathione S-transferase
MNSSKVTLGYWRVRGRGQVPRLLLAYTGAVWEDVQYTSPEQWFGNDKQSLQLSFPNLPYLIEGDFRITETSAICTYIIERSARKELLGRNAQERALVLNVVGVIGECLEKLSTIAYSPNGATLLEKTWKDTLEPKLQQLAKFKGNKEWLLGFLTLADFLFAELSYYLENIYREEFKKLNFVLASRHSFEKLPEIKQYYEQEWSIKGPFVAPNMATIKF